jgi:hypothetical protein
MGVKQMKNLFTLDWFFRLSNFAVALLLLFLTAAPGALAQESAGSILALTGKVEIIHAQITVPATRQSLLFSGDSIVTGDGQVQIRFADGTLLTLYRDTRFAVNDYHYGKGIGDRAQFSLINGLIHTLTGQISKDSYQIKTRLANLGVRGTEYSASLGEQLHVSVDTGTVVVENAGGTLLVNAGNNAVVTGANAMPQPGGKKIDLHGGRPAQKGGPPQQGTPPQPGTPPPPVTSPPAGAPLPPVMPPQAGAPPPMSMPPLQAGPAGVGGAGALPPPPPPGVQNMLNRPLP